VAINEWWLGQPHERYWLEITDRETLGVDLRAPKTDQSGKETWSYSLVSYVRDGDVVFHYWKQAGQEKAIVAYSRATGTLQSTTIHWQPHGTYGRTSAAKLPPRPAWLFPLSNFRDLSTPITLEQLRILEPELTERSQELAKRFGGPLYLPFVFSKTRPLRTAQGYLTKLPLSFVQLIPALQKALQVPMPHRVGERRPPNRSTETAGNGYQPDPVIRKAVERHAVNLVLKYFNELGYLTEDVGNSNPYDVLAISNDSELHVEVKGCTGVGTTVELTAGEVKEATTTRGVEAVLVVVDQITWTRDGSGPVVTAGGRLRVWRDWTPDAQRLTPTSFRYLLPPGGQPLPTTTISHALETGTTLEHLNRPAFVDNS
jgi:hypothetical protein